MRIFKLSLVIVAMMSGLLAPAAAAQAADFLPNSFMVFENSGKCADDPAWNTGLVRLDQYTCVNQANEEWDAIPDITYPYFEIVNSYSGLCMNVAKASTSNGAYVIQYSCSFSAANGLWYLAPNNDGSFTAVNVHSHLCLNVAGYSSSNNANLIQYSCGPYLGYYKNEDFHWQTSP